MLDRMIPVYTKCPHCKTKLKQSNLAKHIANKCETFKNTKLGLEPKATKNQRRNALEQARVKKEAIIKGKMFLHLTNVDASHRKALVNELFTASNGNESNAIKRAKAYNQALEIQLFHLDDAQRIAAQITKIKPEFRLEKAKELLAKHNGNYRKAFYEIDKIPASDFELVSDPAEPLKIGELYYCRVCNRQHPKKKAKHFTSLEAFIFHYKNKHGNISTSNLEVDPITNFTGKRSEASITPLSPAKEAVSKPTSNTPVLAYFNVEAYQKALRTMTQSEAYKIAKDENLSQAFLISVEASVSPSNPIDVVALSKAVEKPVAPPVVANDVVYKGRTVEVTHNARNAADQADFKRRVRANFNGKCAITGYALPEGVLEAAHIEGVTVAGNMNTSNGILLEVTLHRMFDKGLMGIEPNTLKVHFAIDCLHKVHFEGCTLQPHKVALDKSKLSEKWEMFISLNKVIV